MEDIKDLPQRGYIHISLYANVFIDIFKANYFVPQATF